MKYLGMGLIRFYQLTFSAVLPPSCRFTPSCSRYAEVVIARDGVVHGGWLALKRLARCGPWTPAGAVDEP